ncbi:hypothetical protein ASPVEDRAFT_445672 [Aspergillus versicolor CBS 583.65]|uniref:Uncharacterized protein n=1 Tax=Aspergillus versicolor CBS 583.65 TaxID=1036611 RepID=A0A1L9P9H0_ASPVE|nr:uncharacterized protein ASPVEDRAFT_445672 [Aspergillus versicolor CBS 583.65]OJI98125.1 hypothetical protein ASPVEDRAFT_445672 [Aspergillus versicolor CBS 583.65]
MISFTRMLIWWIYVNQVHELPLFSVILFCSVTLFYPTRFWDRWTQSSGTIMTYCTKVQLGIPASRTAPCVYLLSHGWQRQAVSSICTIPFISFHFSLLASVSFN